jgi:hypothetical protein
MVNRLPAGRPTGHGRRDARLPSMREGEGKAMSATPCASITGRSRRATPPAALRGLLRLVRLVAIGLLAGAVAGFLAGGVGSRLAMRAVTLLAGDEHRGRLTEAQARVGEITTEGTLFLFFAGTFLGLGGGLLYVAVRRWLPGRPWQKGLAFGVWSLTVLGWVIIDGNNVDFQLFVPSAVSVGLFATLYLLFGLIVAPLVELLDRTGGRRPTNRFLALTGYAILLAVALAFGLPRDLAALRAIF